MTRSEIQPHPVFAERLANIAERVAAGGLNLLAAELFDMAAGLTPKGEGYRQRASALRADARPAEDPDREHKRRNLEASHAVGMAHVFEARGELKRAQEMFDLAKLRAPFHYLAYAGAGYLHLRWRDLARALEELIQARRLNPLDRKLAVEVARVALELEDYPEALRHAIDAMLLTQGFGEGEEQAARRRVETLASLCRLSEQELAGLYRQRAATLQRASEQVALTRARLFSSLNPARAAKAQRATTTPERRDLLRTALELRRFRVFRHLTDAQLVQLAQIGRQEAFRHAQVLLREGQSDRDVLVVLAGRLHTCRTTPAGTHVLNTLTLGDIVGEVSFLDRQPRPASIIGVEAGIILRLPAAELDALLAGERELHAALLWSFWHSLSGKVRAANQGMTDLLAPGAPTPRRGVSPTGERIFLDTAAKLDLLKEQGLSAAELRLLATYSTEEHFPPNAFIFAEGEHGEKLYIVVDGQVRISRRFDDTGEEALAILGRGEVFGEMALIDDRPRSADAKAHLEGCTVFSVDRQRLEEVLEMDPDAARQFLGLLCTVLCRRLRAMLDRLVAWRLMAQHA